MVVGFTTTFVPVQSVSITTNVVSSNSFHGGVYLIQHPVTNFVSDMRQIGGFLQALQFPLTLSQYKVITVQVNLYF
jgi:hypothetical protein